LPPAGAEKKRPALTNMRENRKSQLNEKKAAPERGKKGEGTCRPGRMKINSIARRQRPALTSSSMPETGGLKPLDKDPRIGLQLKIPVLCLERGNPHRGKGSGIAMKVPPSREKWSPCLYHGKKDEKQDWSAEKKKIAPLTSHI